MATFHDIIGQEQIKEHLQNAISAKKISHAYIINGEKSSGKEFIARVFAMTLQCEKGGTEPCQECHSCKQALSDNQPDIIYVSHEKPNTISVDDIRTQLNNDIVIKPYSSKHKIYIVDEAEKMNQQAQNALLKTIEEPPAYAFFILTAEQPDSLLQTVRSRCTKFALEPSQAAVSDEEAASLLAPYLSAVAERREDRMMLGAMGLEKTPRRALLGVLGILQAAVRDAIFVSKALPQKPLQPALRKQTQALAGAVSMERLLAVYDFIDVLIDRVSRNAASAAVTCALTSDIYRICYAS